ncbi:TetR/AcrR family transcriptional regulator [Kineococcus gypseus]|uniref:TetR/AcrR family transcriptional regulator n=1 Tax=Kineococcus gypseus TaxID=1637102 RepID=UPI003D7CC30E
MAPEDPRAPAAAGTGAAPRPLRADARRNRDAVLRAAREAFEQEGVFTSLDGIAARAGVGNATLYRHFPTREDLLAAVIESSIATALEQADDLVRALPPREALAEWLVLLTWRLRTWHDLPSCLAGADESASPVRSACDPLRARTAALLEVARAAGDVAGGVTVDEVYELVVALSWAVDRFGTGEAAARRRVAVATAGLFA